MSVISLPTELPTAPVVETGRHGDRHLRLKHLGRAEAMVLRDDDVMRIGVLVRLNTVNAASLSIISPVLLRLGEQVKIKLRNDVQRFATELRGVARRLA